MLISDPVSYTHLDVYKRQTPPRGIVNPEAMASAYQYLNCLLAPKIADALAVMSFVFDILNLASILPQKPVPYSGSSSNNESPPYNLTGPMSKSSVMASITQLSKTHRCTS